MRIVPLAIVDYLQPKEGEISLSIAPDAAHCRNISFDSQAIDRKVNLYA
jgi:hypothetical protein